MELRLLHPAGPGWRERARRVAESLAAALGEPVVPGTSAGGTPPWALVPGSDFLREPPPADRIVVLPRRDPAWGLRDLLRRPLEGLPAGSRVLVPSTLGEGLLRRARPDLVPVRAGTVPLPEETPELVEGPRDGGGGGETALDPARFLPAPGTGVEAILAPEGAAIPEAVRGLEDPPTRVALSIERAFAEGAGPLEPGAALGVLAKPRLSALFQVRAILFLPGAPPRELRADIPLADARTFARAFGGHLRASTNEIRKGA